jgi:hypothetical protein
MLLETQNHITMKNKNSKAILYGAMMIALISMTMIGGCKKCFNCTSTLECSYCKYPNGSADDVICDQGNNDQDYLEARVNCQAMGATWTVASSNKNTVEFCSKSNSAISTRQASCEQGNGVWSSK